MLAVVWSRNQRSINFDVYALNCVMGHGALDQHIVAFSTLFKFNSQELWMVVVQH